MSVDLSDHQLERYARHILLDSVGISGQQRLAAASALIVGLGGLGSPAAMYLAASGLGRLILADGDDVDLSNLQRQLVHRSVALGKPKVESALVTLMAINPEPAYDLVGQRLDGQHLEALVGRVNVVLDCSDNFSTRQQLNRACVRHRVPLVSGAAIGLDGQCAVYDLRREDSPCYHCLFPADLAPHDVACATMGVFAPLTGMVGSMQAGLALRLLLGLEVQPELLLVDARQMSTRGVSLRKDPCCAVCKPQPLKLAGQ
jgi:adenylyltransferase/sulfurtransferase